MRDHVVLCGSDVLAARVLEELGALGVDVVVIAQDPDRRLETRMRELGVVVIDGDYRDEETLYEADAEAVAVLEEDDVGNVHAALAAQEANPDVRLVVRMFNLDLGHRLEELFQDGEVLSASVLAAPNGRRLAVDVREAPDEPESSADAVVRQAPRWRGARGPACAGRCGCSTRGWPRCWSRSRSCW
jgi:Trk K+ transport system NAD-binding subunit